MQKVFLNALVFLILLLSCSDNNTGPDDIYKVSGIVYYDGLPRENVTVSIDNNIDWIGLTNSDGYFEINGVSMGDHLLKTTTMLNDGSFSERSNEIAVYDNIQLNNIVLPKAVHMHDLFQITYNSISMMWSRSNASDFREYKVYRHNTSGLDETTGILAHVSTSIDDTIFTDTDLLPLESYYYRVYVMNEYGRLGGSNIVSAITEKLDIIKNGDFEIINPTERFPEYWNHYENPGGTITLDSLEVVKSGRYSLKFSLIDEADGFEFFMIQHGISPSLFNPGSRYKLSGWYRIDYLGGEIIFSYLLRGNTEGDIASTYGDDRHPSLVNAWEQFEFEFTIPEGSSAINYKLYLHLIKWNSHNTNLWIDDVHLEKI